MGRLATALGAAIVVATPVVLVGNALWLLVNPWIVDAAYAVPGFPADPLGLFGDDARDELATIGVRAIRPQDEGVALLREARLPDGQPAFNGRELRHMQDVRALVAGFLVAWAIALGVALFAALALRRVAGWPAVRRALAYGGGGTMVVGVVAGVFALVAFDAFFTAFHGVFFEGRSWRFEDHTTLRRVYPDAFWGIAGGLLALLILLQAVVLRSLLPWRRGSRQRAPAS